MVAGARTQYTEVESPLGTLLVVGESNSADELSLTSLSMPDQRNAPVVDPAWRHAPESFRAIADQIRAYFAGELTEFDIEFASTGTPFQRRVWEALERIPFGVSTTYGALAGDLGVPRDRIQALGAAIGANPVLLIRPCHRVIGADGSMRGYAGGVERKVALLTHEGVLQPALLAPMVQPATNTYESRQS